MEIADRARTPRSALIRSFLTGTSMNRRLPVWSTLSWSAIGAARLARLTGARAPRRWIPLLRGGAEQCADWRPAAGGSPCDGPGRIRIGYPVTVSDCVDTGAAPAPRNADPTPLNITSVTVYRP